ncbi:MAG: Crp/Fnr family transcriptional regulator [Methylomicrobium sp.]
MTTDIEILRNNELFSELDDKALASLAHSTQPRTFLKNSLILCEGDSSNAMYIIRKGKVNITLTHKDGKEMILATLHPGDNFGELALLDDAPRSANVIALETCELIVLYKTEFFQLLEQNPTLGLSIIRYLCKRIRFLTDLAQGLALLDVYGRLVRLLYSLAEPMEDGKRIVTLPLTHKDIAMRVGSSREMISRILSELEKGDYITCVNKRIVIVKKLPSAW